LFIGSFTWLWWVLMLDDNLWRIIVLLVIVIAGVVAIWGWLRKLLGELKAMVEGQRK
jgi:hypothetical protein